MADASYDVVIIGGGNKGLVTGMYLAKYAGLDVAIFEKRHEAGGGWSTDEGAAPGFLADYHATGVGGLHTLSVEQDFPEWKEVGGGYSGHRVAFGTVFQDDDSCFVIYSRRVDRSQEKSAESIAMLSQRDAETWVKLQARYGRFISAYIEFAYNLPSPPGKPDALDKLLMDPGSGIDPTWAIKTPLEVLRDIFESDALVAAFLRQALSYGIFPTAGDGLLTYLSLLGTPSVSGVPGGTHSWAHAACRIFLTNGGKIFTNSEVDGVIIENGKATGIRLTDGTEVGARKFVVSTLDPYTLCFRLIGKEYFDWRTLRRVENIERRFTTITWYTWALHALPNYKAASINPDINEATQLEIVSKDPEDAIREYANRLSGRMPDKLLLAILSHSIWDKTRAPEGKYTVLTEQFVLPANALSEKQWIEFKKSHAEEVMKLWGKHTTNMTWDNIIGYVPLTPYDHCRLANMAPTGNWAVIDHFPPGQFGKYRPTPELASHRTPVKNLYATGSAWHPYGSGGCFQGYNCYKVTAEDFGLRKLWEEKGRPW